MANVYYKLSGVNCFYTNEAKSGYTLYDKANFQHDASPTIGYQTVIELYNNKFILPENSYQLFYHSSSTSFNDMDKWDTSQVVNMGGLFQDCTSLTTIDLSHFNTSKVTNMSNMFAWCHQLTSLDVSSLNTSKVTDMGHMFDTCRGITSIDVSNFDTSKVTNMEFMFNDCKSLQTARLGVFDVSSCTDFYAMFSDAESLEHIYVPLNTDWNKTAAGRFDPFMFARASKLPNYDLSSDHGIRCANNTEEWGVFDGDPVWNAIITWKNWDGTQLAQKVILKGEFPKFETLYPSLYPPTKPSDKLYTYSFSGWSPVESIRTSDTTYTAQYDQSDVLYEITWKNIDGSTIEVDYLKYDDFSRPSCSITPTYSEYGYKYTFLTWTPLVTPVTSNKVYTAVYNIEVDPRIPNIRMYSTESGWNDLYVIYNKGNSAEYPISYFWQKVFPFVKVDGKWVSLELLDN